eukprot:PhM_4_TR18480/c1_g1_i1/m.65409
MSSSLPPSPNLTSQQQPNNNNNNNNVTTTAVSPQHIAIKHTVLVEFPGFYQNQLCALPEQHLKPVDLDYVLRGALADYNKTLCRQFSSLVLSTRTKHLVTDMYWYVLLMEFSDVDHKKHLADYVQSKTEEVAQQSLGGRNLASQALQVLPAIGGKAAGLMVDDIDDDDEDMYYIPETRPQHVRALSDRLVVPPLKLWDSHTRRFIRDPSKNNKKKKKRNDDDGGDDDYEDDTNNDGRFFHNGGSVELRPLPRKFDGSRLDEAALYELDRRSATSNQQNINWDAASVGSVFSSIHSRRGSPRGATRSTSSSCAPSASSVAVSANNTPATSVLGRTSRRTGGGRVWNKPAPPPVVVESISWEPKAMVRHITGCKLERSDENMSKLFSRMSATYHRMFSALTVQVRDLVLRDYHLILTHALLDIMYKTLPYLRRLMTQAFRKRVFCAVTHWILGLEFNVPAQRIALSSLHARAQQQHALEQQIANSQNPFIAKRVSINLNQAKGSSSGGGSPGAGRFASSLATTRASTLTNSTSVPPKKPPIMTHRPTPTQSTATTTSSPASSRLPSLATGAGGRRKSVTFRYRGPPRAPKPESPTLIAERQKFLEALKSVTVVKNNQELQRAAKLRYSTLGKKERLMRELYTSEGGGGGSMASAVRVPDPEPNWYESSPSEGGALSERALNKGVFSTATMSPFIIRYMQDNKMKIEVTVGHSGAWDHNRHGNEMKWVF